MQFVGKNNESIDAQIQSLVSTLKFIAAHHQHFKSYMKKDIIRTLFGCQATLVTEESCLFLISLLTHLRKRIVYMINMIWDL